MPTFTSPASLLCSRSGDEIFITTGKPIAFAARTAAAAEFTSSSFDDLMPYALSSCLLCHSDSASPDSRSASSVRAFFAAGDGVVGAVSNGER